MVAWEVQNHWFFIVFSIESCFWRFSKNLENFIENRSKMLPKSIKNLTFGARGPNLLDFGRIFEESNFWWCFVSLFGASQSEKCRFREPFRLPRVFTDFTRGPQPGPPGEFGSLCREGLGRVSGILVSYLYIPTRLHIINRQPTRLQHARPLGEGRRIC